MKPVQVAIRVDASSTIGSGHMMRCMTLAAALLEHGCRVRFVTREHEGHLAAMIESRGFDCVRLPIAGKPRGDSMPAGIYAQWLGCSQEDDARETAASLGGGDPVDWLIVDHYALDAQWESRMRSHARHVMVIDDLANRQHDCDLLLDQNLYVNRETRYSALVPQDCDLLLGPHHALLSPEFARQRTSVEAKRFAAPYRILVFFGGVDATGEGSRFLHAWARVGREDLSADFVTGIGNPHATALTEFAATLPRVRVHRHLHSMASMMAEADYAFGACGATNWERFCTGLNSTLTGVAENQLPLARDLAALGLVDYLGDWRQASVGSYERALADLDPGAQRLLQRRAHILTEVDGHGARRVVERLTNTGAD
jgi:UDP-2,4-diacetamido-2,4,6-trideoxy-beta-L-altropyranose hydrolase